MASSASWASAERVAQLDTDLAWPGERLVDSERRVAVGREHTALVGDVAAVELRGPRVALESEAQVQELEGVLLRAIGHADYRDDVADMNEIGPREAVPDLSDLEV